MRDLTGPARELSPADDRRMRAFMESHAGEEPDAGARREPPAQQAA